MCSGNVFSRDCSAREWVTSAYHPGFECRKGRTKEEKDSSVRTCWFFS